LPEGRNLWKSFPRPQEMTYYQEHRQRILERAKTKVVCPCGAVVGYANLGFHRKSVRHLIWVQGQKGGTERSEGGRRVEPGWKVESGTLKKVG
jgi:hypothetical protein